jgi:hypothetical protein
MPKKLVQLAAVCGAALVLTATSAQAQVFPPQAQPKLLRGSGVFTQESDYAGPIVGYVNKDISSPFTFSLSYFNFNGSDILLPGTVQITDPELFRNQVSFTGQLSIAMTGGNDYSFAVANNSLIEYLTLNLQTGAPLSDASGPVPVQPGSTIGFSGRFFGYTGSITSLSTTPEAAVPEVETWAMMMVGLGFVGAALRRRASTKPLVRPAPPHDGSVPQPTWRAAEQESTRPSMS